LWGCDGDSGGQIDDLPLGSGLFFTTVFPILPGAAAADFFKVNEVTGETTRQAVPDDEDDSARCPSIRAMDSRPDGVVLVVGDETAAIYQADPRVTRCKRVVSTPEIMRAIAVRSSDGHIFTVSGTNQLYEFDSEASVLSANALQCPAGRPGCTVEGIDFGSDETLYSIEIGGFWGSIDTASAVVQSINSSVGLSDDFDIDANDSVRGLAGDEFRTFDLGGMQMSQINVQGGTALATGVVYR